MPQSADSIEASAYQRLLVLGGPKTGKTCTVLATCEKPAYVINSDDKYSLRPALQFTRDFDFDLVLGNDVQAMQAALHAARQGVKEGRYKTVVWDTISKYAARAEELFAAASANAKGEPDGRRYWPQFRKHLHNVIDRLFDLKAHVIVNAHYLDVSSVVIEGQTDKAGVGVVPMIGGSARVTIPAEFQDVVFLEKRAGKRMFIASSDGVWGPGCRSLPGVTEAPADVGELWRMMRSGGVKVKKVKSK